MPDCVDTRDVEARMIWESKEFCDSEWHWAARRQKARTQLERATPGSTPTDEQIEQRVKENIEKQFETWYADMKMRGLVR